MKDRVWQAFLSLLFLISSAGITGCNEKLDGLKTSTDPNQRYLYFASGGCFVGNYTGSRVATTTSAGLINRITLDSAQIQGVQILDYNLLGSNLWPAGIINYDSDYLLAAVSTTTTGVRIDKVKKAGLQEKKDHISDVTNLNGFLRAIGLTTDKSTIISKSSAIEKYTSGGVRVLNAALTNSFAVIPTTGTTCSSTTSTLTAAISLPNDFVFFANGNAGFTKVGVIGSAGYSAVADCKSAISFTTTPAPAAQPTAAVYVAGTDPYQVLVSTASTTAGNDQIWLFTVNSSTGVVSYVKSLYNNTAYLRGISAMAYDSTSNSLYVANGATIATNTIEKFSYDSSAQTLTRSGTFFAANADTQCINSMFVGN